MDTCRLVSHLSTRVREHLFSNKNSHIYKHLKSSSACRGACNENCFAVLDSANTAYKLRIKEEIVYNVGSAKLKQAVKSL